MAVTATCYQCDETATMAMQPAERRRYLRPNERPTMLSTTHMEWLCPNGHFREMTYAEVRQFE